MLRGAANSKNMGYKKQEEKLVVKKVPNCHICGYHARWSRKEELNILDPLKGRGSQATCDASEERGRGRKQ